MSQRRRCTRNWQSRYFPRKFVGLLDAWRNDVVHGRGYLRERPDSHLGLQAVKPQCRITELVERTRTKRGKKNKWKSRVGWGRVHYPPFKLSLLIIISQWINIVFIGLSPLWMYLYDDEDVKRDRFLPFSSYNRTAWMAHFPVASTRKAWNKLNERTR